MVDVHIVGGGPAGCFAGIAACLEGKSVLLSEEHKVIGEPEACSGLVSKSGLESLRPHVDYRKIVLNSITSANIHAGKVVFSIRPKNETAYLISRKGLDRMASESYLSLGGKLELGRRVSGNFASRCIIGADGPASSVAEKFGFPRIGSFVACMQGDFRYSCEHSHTAEIYLSAKEFPGFFGWTIPINEEEAKIGVGVSLPHHPLKHYRKFLSFLGVAAKPANEFAAIIPTSVRKRTAIKRAGRSVLLAGDAAGQVKATTGGGIFFGAQCGFLAGQNFSSPEKYERAWKSRFGFDLSLHRHFRTALDINDGEPPSVFIAAAKAVLFEELVSEKGEMDCWGKMLGPSLPISYASIVARKIAGGVI